MDSSGILIGWNDHAAALFGWSGDEAVGRRLSDLIIPPDLRPVHERGLAHYLATGEGPVLNRRIEVSALNRMGEQFPVELSITASMQFGDPLFVGFVRDITERIGVVERQQRLLQESNHRVKNMLTVVEAISRQTARVSTGIDDFLAAFSGRLRALAEAHSLLANKEWQDVSLGTLAEQVLGADVEAGRAEYSGPEILLPARQVLGLSMILHELYTNSIKYGALCTDHGSIELRWSVDDDQLTLVWMEAGPACPPREPRSGFGKRMIDMAVKSELGGELDRRWTDDGLVVEVRFPLAD